MFGMIPFSRNENAFDLFDSLFHEQSATAVTFRTDIRDMGDRFLLEAELPGFSKGEISLDLKDSILTITAQHKQENQEEAGQYIRRERRQTSFTRTFDVSGIDEGAITAAYENGILALTLPKQAPVVPESRRISIG